MEELNNRKLREETSGNKPRFERRQKISTNDRKSSAPLAPVPLFAQVVPKRMRGTEPRAPEGAPRVLPELWRPERGLAVGEVNIGSPSTNTMGMWNKLGRLQKTYSSTRAPGGDACSCPDHHHYASRTLGPRNRCPYQLSPAIDVAPAPDTEVTLSFGVKSWAALVVVEFIF